jgi:hypothetical protein
MTRLAARTTISAALSIDDAIIVGCRPLIDQRCLA